MKIGSTGYEMIRSRDGSVIRTNFNAKKVMKEEVGTRAQQANEVYNYMKRFSEVRRGEIFADMQAQKKYPELFTFELSEEEINQQTPEELVTMIAERLINFFSEFQFEPNFRFFNTLAFSNATQQEGLNYVGNYFALTNHPYANAIKDKIKSPEFKQILSDLRRAPTPKTHINTRFKLYFGSQGTGKTTKALTETNDLCMVCNNGMLPTDLIKSFDFNDENGNPTFRETPLVKCMREGKPIVLDEINLLPFESLRFLQSILDGKEKFVYDSKEFQVKDGFCIIGTMNLVVNGMAFGLPEPLIDRCQYIKEFKLKAKDLIGAIL